MKVKLSLCLINHVLCHEHIWGGGGEPSYSSTILDFRLEGAELHLQAT
jgi:hypothetical protein